MTARTIAPPTPISATLAVLDAPGIAPPFTRLIANVTQPFSPTLWMTPCVCEKAVRTHVGQATD
jgi:hypothetical protein